ncbi:MAG: RDD family protein [Nitrospirae bacterium]|jgi:uncharacterized RDD family membrane protein YckC|nr:RDD family protein [Nitrospirota bacterium]
MRLVRLLTFFLDLSIAHFCFRFWTYLWFSEKGFSVDRPLLSLLMEVLFVFLYFWFLVSLWSQTPGMVLLGIRIAKEEHASSSVGVLRAFSRTFFLFVTNLPLGMGALFSLLSPAGKTLYDCLSQTRVVWDEKLDRVSRTKDELRPDLG